MLHHLIIRAAVVAGCLVYTGLAAQTPAPKTLLVQVTFAAGLPASANDGEDPGRVEVTNAGRFVGCAWAAWYRPFAGEIKLVPLAIGYITVGRPEDIRVDVQGELGRLAKPAVKITEISP